MHEVYLFSAKINETNGAEFTQGEISKIKQKYSLRVEDIDLFQKDVEIVREGEVESLSRHFRSKIEEARKISGEAGSVQSFHATIKEELQQFDNE